MQLVTVIMLGVLVVLAATTVALVRAIAGLRSADKGKLSGDLPALLVIRPVRGVDPGLEENLRAALTQRYPGVMETLFVVDDESDPAVPAIRRAIERYASDARIVVSGTSSRGRTGKLHAMIRGMEAASLRHGLVSFADSDTRPGPTLLRDLARAVVARSEVGAAFARAVCPQKPETPWDIASSLLLDGVYGPQAALGMVRRGALPFIMGQTMVLRRNALSAAGGLEGSHGQLVDDMHIGQRMHAAGYHNLLCADPVPLIFHGVTWPEFRANAVRWITYSRTGIPFWPFNAPVVAIMAIYYTGLLGAVGALLAGSAAGASWLLACALAASIAVEVLRTKHGGAKAGRFVWVVPIVMAMIPFFFLRAYLAKSVVWRGREYSLDRAGGLETQASLSGS